MEVRCGWREWMGVIYGMDRLETGLGGFESGVDGVSGWVSNMGGVDRWGTGMGG